MNYRETCAIEQREMRVVRRKPNGSVEEVIIDKESSVVDEDLTTSRMIDWALGLTPDQQELGVIKDAYNNMGDWEQSINQTVNYMKDVSISVDFEVKKKNSAIIPEVQLAVWASALFIKRRHHKWDTSIPTPGIVIAGHQWECYILFERSAGKLVSTIFYIGGPILYPLSLLLVDDDGSNPDWYHTKPLWHLTGLSRR